MNRVYFSIANYAPPVPGPPADLSMIPMVTFLVAAAYAEFSKSAAIPIVYALVATQVTSWDEWYFMSFMLLVMTILTRGIKATTG